MKTLMCTLAAVMSVALGSAVFAAGKEYLQTTGTVVKSEIPGVIVIETAPKEYVSFHMEAGAPKVGEKVTVYYDPSQVDRRGFWFAMKIENGGRAGKGSKKN